MDIPISEMPGEELNQLNRKENWTLTSVISRLNLWDERCALAASKCRQSVTTPPGFIDGAIIDLTSRTQSPYY